MQWETCPSPGDSSKLFFLREWAFVTEKTPGVFHNYYSFAPHFRSTRKSFSDSHPEKLVELLEIRPIKVWGPSYDGRNP